MGNFIKIERKMLDWEWWQDINTSRLFLFMLLSAYWKDGRYKGTEIKRGSFPSSTMALARGTSLTENEIRTALKHLKSTNEITNKNHGKYTVFTVVKYNEYQGFNEQECNQNAIKIQTVNEQLTNTLLKEDKKEKKGKNNNIFCAAAVDYLNKKSGSNFKSDSKSTQRLVNGRIDDGFSLEDFKKVIDTMCDKWKHDEKMRQYLRPQTLFGTKFESYLNMAPKQQAVQMAKKPQEEEDEEKEVDDEQWKRDFDKEGANK